MSRHDTKHSKKMRGMLNLPPAALLPQRLNALWGDPAWPQGDDAALQGELDALSKGVSSVNLIATLLKAYQVAPVQAQTRLDHLIPAWLRSRGHLPALREAVARNSLAGAERERAAAWLQAVGETPAIQPQTQESDAFFDAFFLDNRSQAVIIILWYRDMQRTQVQGMSFLLDDNPPWDGAIKDITHFPRETPFMALQKYVEFWEKRGTPMSRGSPVEAKRLGWEGLTWYQGCNIRLPLDLIANRASFIRYVLPLPDGPETPPFSESDFDTLAQTGQRPEEIRHFERTVGYRARTEDGQEILIMGGGLEDDW